MNQSELQILISMRDEFSNKLDSIEKSVKKSGKTAKSAESDFKKLAVAVGGVALAYKSLRIMKETLSLFGEQEQMFVRLATLTKNSTNATNEQIYALNEQARALEQTGVVSQSNILTLQGQLATYDLNTESIKKLTPALLDMAVAERGVNVTQQDMISFAEGVSRAIQGNYSALSRRGFILDEDTKKIIENGNEQERVDEIVKVMNSTYQDMNNILAETSSGSMTQYQNKMNSIKQEIGGSLVPAMIMMQDGFIDLITIQDDTADSLQSFGEVMYRTANFGMGIFHTLKASAVGVVGVIDIGVARLTGGVEASKGKIEQWGETASKAWGDAGSSFENWFGEGSEYKNLREGFDISKLRGSGGGAGFESLLGGDSKELEKEAKKIEKELEQIANAFEKFGDTYKQTNEKIGDSLFDLRENHKKTTEGFSKDIQRIRKSMNDLNKSFGEGEKSDRQKLAEEIVSNEKRVLEIEEELKKRLRTKERVALEAELAERVSSQEENSVLIASLEEEMSEVKRRAGLTDLQRSIEDFNSRIAIATQEHSEKMAVLQNELRAVRDAQKEERKMYDEKRRFIIEQRNELRKNHEEAVRSNLLITKEGIDKEIQYYRKLASAIDSVRGSNTSARLNRNVGKFESVNDAIISPNGKIITTHPDDYLIATKNPQSLGGGGGLVINIGTMIGEEEYARRMGDQIMKGVGFNTSF